LKIEHETLSAECEILAAKTIGEGFG
jgi:hypothetical protein